MIRALVEQTFDQQKKYFVLAGSSSDVKPTSGLITGSEFHEVDTGTKYEFDEASSTWNAVGLSPEDIKAEIDAWLDEHPEATTTVQDGAITYAKLDASLQGTIDDVSELQTDVSSLKSEVAYKDGSYPDLTSGSAEQLLSTTGVTDKVPYLFRPSAGDGADREQDKIVGGTVAWNQLFNKTRYLANGSTGAGFTLTNNGNGYVLINGTYSGSGFFGVASNTSLPWVKDHKYLINVPSMPSGVSGSTVTRYGSAFGNGLINGSTILNALATGTGEDLYFRFAPTSALTVTNFKYYADIYDLTAMFGSTIADYLYTLESATAGAGVAWFKKLFPNDYYPYNAGELLSVNTSAHEMVGFNQWDEEWENGYISSSGGYGSDSSSIRSKNFNPCFPSTEYYIRKNGHLVQLCWYDSEQNFISRSDSSPQQSPANARYFKITSTEYGRPYKYDICINLSNAALNGEYQPYVKHTYALDSDLTLRGIPKLDANNKLYYDGDTYEADGTVTRNYQQRAYQSGDESLTDAITDGTNTVVKLSTPTTETADPYQTPQILDPNGTEAYIDSRDVPIPVGHETFYPTNQVAKLDGLPKDFSTLIAPTEATYKATQAYSSGALFIVNNILYKATASIANGATITPGTNCQATTLAAVIAALA
jgi:hypothetical protein